MKKLLIISVLVLSGMLVKSQDTTNISTNNKITSLGFITGFDDKSWEEWSLGMSFSTTIYKNWGLYVDANFGRFDTYISTPDFYEYSTTSYLTWHGGANYSINRWLRPYVGVGMRHLTYSAERTSSKVRSNSFNTSIGFNIGSKKSVVGFQGGVELDFAKSGFGVNGLAGITINF